MADLARLILIFGLICTLASAGFAQDRATLLADSLSIVGNSRLVATGHVEIFYQGQRLVASGLIYDAQTDQLTISGPIRIEDGNGNFILADAAQLSADLTEGILTSARLVLANRLQLAAAEVRRSAGGRYTGLVQVVASSCRICAGSSVPLWEIRASSVLHDAQEQQLYFNDAQLRFYGIPVFYAPRLRLPDPTLDRASGFLVPRLSSSSSQGFGIRLPYFLTLGSSRDLTLTPFLTTKGGRTVELQYREALRMGTYTISGALSDDRLTPGPLRGYLKGEGEFFLPMGFNATVNGIVVSDAFYLSDYGVSNADRLQSEVAITRTRRNEYIDAQIIGFQSLRSGEGDGSLPTVVGDLIFHRRFSGGPLGGQSGMLLEAHNHYRPSDLVTDTNGDGIADGRDLARLSFTGDWRRNWTLQSGLLVATMAEVYADYYDISQDATFGGQRWRTHGVLATELRWPLTKSDAKGNSQMIEPVLQLVLAPPADSAIPNEDSALVEFDEGNLFDLNRFPGTDGKEAGTHLNLGVNYLYQGAGGWSMGTTVGRVLRLADLNQFSDASGLSGTTSDWLMGVSVLDGNGLSLQSRMLLDNGLDPTKSELRLDLARDTYSLALGLTDMAADPAENRDTDLRELVLDGSFDIDGNWTARGDTRFDLLTRSTTSAGLGLAFVNECINVDLSVSRRFTSSTSVRSATDFGLTVELLGFGSGDTGPQRQCRN